MRSPSKASVRWWANQALGRHLPLPLQAQLASLRANGVLGLVRWNAMIADAWVRDRRGRRRYRELSGAELVERRTSDTVFVFGSGYSLNDLTGDEWAYIAEHDTFGFNLFFHQRWIPVGFHLLRGGVYGSLHWREYAENVGRLISESPFYENTVFLLQGEYYAQFSNQLIGYGILPADATVYRYRTLRGYGPPSESLEAGFRHAMGTLDDSVNAAYLMGWKNIVLVGVDLYDSRYFWLPPDKTQAINQQTGEAGAGERNLIRGQRYDETHNTARNGVVQLMDEWGAYFESRSVRLSVYNPRSLLAAVLPVYEKA